MKITSNIEQRIKKTFDWGKETGIKFNKNKTGDASHSTLDSYANVVKVYNKWLQMEHGLSIDRAKPRHAYEYINRITEQVKTGQRSAWTLKSIPHALHAFQSLSGSSGAFKRQLKVGDKNVMLQSIRDKGVKRQYTNSHSLKATQADFEKVMDKMQESSSMYKDYAIIVHEAQRQLGLRVHEAVKIQVKDINFDTKQIKVKGKGGLERFISIQDKKYLKHLKRMCDGKKGGADVFRVQNRAGDPPSRNYRMKIVKEEVRKAADAAGVERDGKTYTTHSARKAYAQERVNDLKRLHEKSIQKMFTSLCKLDDKFKAKSNQELKNIREKIKAENSSSRELSKKEKILFMVSCEIGHFRLDVMRYYVTY